MGNELKLVTHFYFRTKNQNEKFEHIYKTFFVLRINNILCMHKVYLFYFKLFFFVQN